MGAREQIDNTFNRKLYPLSVSNSRIDTMPDEAPHSVVSAYINDCRGRQAYLKGEMETQICTHTQKRVCQSPVSPKGTEEAT